MILFYASNVVSSMNRIAWRHRSEADTWLSHDHLNVLFGDSGNDILKGNIFNDLLIGGTGLDTITGDAGDDRIYGDGYQDILLGEFE